MQRTDLTRPCRGPRILAALAGLALAGVAAAQTRPNAEMLRFPDVSAEQICFVYANDVWVAPKSGGMAFAVASPSGQESLPRFSPDGKAIAFVGNYEGNRDLYTVTVAGGTAARVTHHPMGEALCDWSADGKQLVFMGSGLAGLTRQSQIFTVPVAGGMPEQLPVPYSGFGAISPDGQWLAYTPHSTDTRTWKRYRGGMATDIWLFNLKDKTSRKITDWEGTDTIPMWAPGGKSDVVYYLSDAGPEHRLNIWSFDVKSGNRKQITSHKNFDVRWPSIGPGDANAKAGEIIFQLGSEIRILDLASGKDRAVQITIPGDRPTVRARAIDASDNITAASISPTGKRVVASGRGDLWSLPAKEGVTRNLVPSDGSYERDPSWSPDGRWIAYFSDADGEYDLYLRPSDAKPPEDKKKDAEKKDDSKEGANDGAKGDDAPANDEETAKADGDAGEKPQHWMAAKPRKLTNLGPGFRYNPVWSPDSKHIAFTDKTGAIMLCDAESGAVKQVARDPWANQPSMSWSHDSAWIAYDLADNDNANNAIWIYNVESGEAKQVTSPMFNSSSPAFSAKGDVLYFQSDREFSNPMYASVDTTFIYNNTGRLYMTPLTVKGKSPYLPTSDEETFKPEEKKEEKKDDAKKDDSKEDKKDEAGKADGEKKDNGDATKQAAKDDAVSGTWEGTATPPAEQAAAGRIPFTLILRLQPDGSVTGSIASPMGSAPISSGKFDKASGKLTVSAQLGDALVNLTGTVSGESMSGEWAVGPEMGKWEATRTSKPEAGAADDSTSAKSDEKKAKKTVEIDFDGFEARAIMLPVPRGNFGGLNSTSDGKLIYVRRSGRGESEPPSIKLFDPSDDSKEEKTITSGAWAYDLSADRKKLLVMRGGRGMTVMDAAAGGGKSTSVPTGNMRKTIDPRTEWKQIFQDVWRLQRDFFYEPTMHGVDWEAMGERYGKLIDDCVTREDVSWVIAELISELNVGHAYVTSMGDTESSPSVSVGLLGADFELAGEGDTKAYRVTRIYEGAPWDADARGPLSQPGVEIKKGDYILAVNGMPIDTSRDIYSAFIATANRVTGVTVSDKPVLDETAREVLVTPVSSESDLRYRAWVEANRKYVEEQTDGQVGYIYVPNTGVDGQNELYRQFFGQRGKAALIIDDRWNGGGQIPTRFIELLNRPIVNYWARRDGNDWPWPPDAHSGPKCMLINGLAGSGGDAFPAYFKQMGLGKLIGMRTWGGLVGISGNPGLVDGGSISVPTFGFYRPDGNWGIEGHGVDPDIEVVDDPAKMVDGGDPQLDAAIKQMLAEIKANPYIPPKRPASPNRSGMGIPENER